ncbi:DUF5798 family protein [Halosimplex salinum]|uniref:DUF5798 family protein n=1 Tax=Halosimplex salinum TaxID=1710538 RepID=UPI000F48FFA9|nr:DUF5798 family protein [Halosimplex salinum]
MPFGDTAKKVQRVTELAEKLYERVNQIVEQVQEVRERVESTSDQIESIDRELAEQRVIVEALAEQQGVDTDAVVEEAFPDPESETEADEVAEGQGTDTEAGETGGEAADSPDDSATTDDAATQDDGSDGTASEEASD